MNRESERGMLVFISYPRLEGENDPKLFFLCKCVVYLWLKKIYVSLGEPELSPQHFWLLEAVDVPSTQSSFCWEVEMTWRGERTPLSSSNKSVKKKKKQNSKKHFCYTTASPHQQKMSRASWFVYKSNPYIILDYTKHKAKIFHTMVVWFGVFVVFVLIASRHEFFSAVISQDFFKS